MNAATAPARPIEGPVPRPGVKKGSVTNNQPFSVASPARTSKLETRNSPRPSASSALLNPPLCNFPAQILPQGDGSYRLTPGKPVAAQTVRARVAAQLLECSIDTIYRLYHSGVLRGRRPSKGNIRIFTASLQQHLANAEDQEFWDR